MELNLLQHHLSNSMDSAGFQSEPKHVLGFAPRLQVSGNPESPRFFLADAGSIPVIGSISK